MTQSYKQAKAWAQTRTAKYKNKEFFVWNETLLALLELKMEKRKERTHAEFVYFSQNKEVQ